MKKDESRSIFELGGDYFREAAVLVAVFGFLEKVVHHENVSLLYAFTAGTASGILFVVGFGLELLRDRLRQKA